MYKIIGLGLFLLIPFLSKAQTVCSLESRQKLEEMLAQFSETDFSKNSTNELVILIGKKFLNTPYVEKTLELPGAEKLVINLNGLDCTTYLETVVTLVRLAKKGEFTFEAFEKELAHLRYRNGMNQGYSSRLHYFSDWIYQNQQKGILTDITQQIGGSPYPNVPSFMSENPKFYAQLADPFNLEKIKATESVIQERNYFYIPKSEISKLENNIQSGDLIAITTSMDNLDIVHTGFAIEKNGKIHLLHASSKNMEVEISEKPLSEYLAGNKSQSGIMVARLTGS
ncbi:N-acetylmuramoyl-L-alanine amidase-like domain-containing protein [Algoriphagus resistens]|uniref:N-acetylmuramoyl-L-alanine amidase-like domain-containing protein n=1 Tax=Algoriphagus resistens TaxID=1750590 RepID=UPI000716885C|nr:N-acetylmuramoyl-L-alanine amidase-like domain-containing protein [Algoriphagus resistens]